MANQRIIDYWHHPAPEGFAEDLFRCAGLRGVYLKIARNFRADEEGDTAFYAEKVCLDKDKFNRCSAIMHMAIMPILIDWAIEGWKTKNRPKA